MERRTKMGAFIGVLFAGAAYLITYHLGFNSKSLTYLLYLYVLLGLLTCSNIKESFNRFNLFNRLVLIGQEEERKLKKVFSDEEYRINGTVEKVSDS